MKIQYFKSSWEDIKHSPGWLGKLCLLALANFIPVFGPILSAGYLYGWAREIAWGVHEPMPSHIIANEDGKFWRRGWCIFLLTFLLSLIPFILYCIGASIESTSVVMTFMGPYTTNDPFLGALSTILTIVAVVLEFIALVFSWVGSMRIAIYDRLSAGFQFGRIWTTIRHDSNGIWRIVGMYLLWMLILCVLVTIIAVFIVLIIVMVGLGGLLSAGYSIESIQYLPEAQVMALIVQFVLSAGLIGFILVFALAFICSLASTFVLALVVRSMGYWTMQFDVARWGGQDDPMPFELETTPAANVAPAPPQPASTSPQVTPAVPQQPMAAAPVATDRPTAGPFNANADASFDPYQAAMPAEAAQQEAAQGADQTVGPEVASVPAEDPQQVGWTQTTGSVVAVDEPLVAGEGFVVSADDAQAAEEGDLPEEER